MFWRYIANSYTLSRALALLIDFYDINTSRIMYGMESLQRLLVHKRETESELHLEAVEAAVKRGRECLENHQRPDGSIGKLEAREFEVWDTANAALALIEAEGDKDCIDKAIGFILGGQLENGSFYHSYVPKALKKYNCVETTSVALIASYKSQRKLSENARRGIDYLIQSQNRDGSWEIQHLPWASKHPSVTGYALKTLLHVNECPKDTFDNALLFLHKSQQKNGSWGRESAYYNTEGYAIKNIIEALTLARDKHWLTGEEKHKIDSILEKCLSYVVKKNNLDGSWSSAGPSSKCISTSLHLQTLLNLLGDLNNEKMKRLVNAAAGYLTEKQGKEGFWYGGKIYKINADLFATSETLVTLSRLVRSAQNPLRIQV